jgi:hypothetical protein
MNYEILIGKTIDIKGSDILVEKIKEHESLFGNKYVINGEFTINSIDIGTAINIELARLEELEKRTLNPFKILKRKFGIFYQKLTLDKPMFNLKVGFRTYGFHSCGVFIQLCWFNKVFIGDFCYDDKESYTNGEQFGTINKINQIF